MIEWVILLALVAVFYYKTSLPPKGYPPGPPIRPFIGSFPSLKGKPLHFVMEDLKKLYGPVIGTKAFGSNFVFVCGAKQAQEVLRKDELQGRPNFDRNRNNPRKGIIFIDANDFWKDQRRFALRHLREFGFGKTATEEVILEEADEFMQMLKEKKQVQISGLFAPSSINILWTMMSGNRFELDDPKLKELLENIDKAFHTPAKKFAFVKSFTIVQKLFPKWAGVEEAEEMERNLRQFLERSVKEHKSTRTDTPRDFIDAYLEELDKPDRKPSFSEETMLVVCMDLFVGGVESVSNSLGFCVLYLTLYPEWQDRMFKQIEELLGKDGRPRLDDRKRLWSGLQDKEHWGDPENFRPERFLNEDGNYKKDDWLVNFGAGKRICVGETFSRDFLFLFLVSLVQKFKIKLPDGHPKPSTMCVPGSTVAPQPFEFEVLVRS